LRVFPRPGPRNSPTELLPNPKCFYFLARSRFQTPPPPFSPPSAFPVKAQFFCSFLRSLSRGSFPLCCSGSSFLSACYTCANYRFSDVRLGESPLELTLRFPFFLQESSSISSLFPFDDRRRGLIIVVTPHVCPLSSVHEFSPLMERLCWAPPRPRPFPPQALDRGFCVANGASPPSPRVLPCSKLSPSSSSFSPPTGPPLLLCGRSIL